MTFWKNFFVAVLLSEENELGAGERSKEGRLTRPPAMANMTTPGPEAIQDIGNKVTGALGDNDDEDDDEDEEDESEAEDDSESDSEESDEEEDDEPTAATARVPPTTPAAAPAEQK